MLDRAEWDRLVAELDEAAEQAADLAALAEADRENAASAAALPPGRQPTVPLKLIEAREAGASPLKAWREYQGISQQVLADRAGVTHDMIARIETGKREGSIATLDRLAAALAVPIDALVARDRASSR